MAILTTYLGVGAAGGFELLRLRLARRAAELLPDVDEDAGVAILELHEGRPACGNAGRNVCSCRWRRCRWRRLRRPGQESGAVSCGTSSSQHEAGLYADVGGCTLLEESARDGDGLERLVARLRAHHLQRRAVDARARLRRHLQGVGSREMGY